jgi:hypothetical protein
VRLLLLLLLLLRMMLFHTGSGCVRCTRHKTVNFFTTKSCT